MRFCCFLIFLYAGTLCFAAETDTLNGFNKKIAGEEINYFSSVPRFAQTALLTRNLGNMPVSWQAPLASSASGTVVYELLIGHSSGTSKNNRNFDIALNNQLLLTLVTPMAKKGPYELFSQGKQGSACHFVLEDYDANNDAFGRLYISVPAELVRKEAVFTITGQNENSRDWLMVFMYIPGLKMILQPTGLVTRKENLRQVTLLVDNPYPNGTPINVRSTENQYSTVLKKGYNKINIPLFGEQFTGADTLLVTVNDSNKQKLPVFLKPVKNYTFYIIHHSHNDIGYSHLQPEVEQIQDNNIYTAIRQAEAYAGTGEKPVWHIESLWAVENFMAKATAKDIQRFVNAVKNGFIELSANYANILTGLCRADEQNWALEYAQYLKKQLGCSIKQVMTTDIPGISKSALQAYVNNGISYLSMGPNYVESFPDKGDRVGGVITEQGDQVFYWKPEPGSEKKLLVWTAGKGYSFFHGITEKEKEQSWEQRIAQYCSELNERNYPYSMIQLRYTKNSDNGPADTTLPAYVEQWNRTYKFPQLKISSVNTLFEAFEKKYGKQIPVKTGEIAPYWEDGAYSTAVEEMEARNLSAHITALQKLAVQKGMNNNTRNLFYRLRRSMVMFHEHTWGAWCSVSDPENPFTTEQWRIKKQFLDSTKYYFAQLASRYHFNSRLNKTAAAGAGQILGFEINPQHGGISRLITNRGNIVSATGALFEPVYVLGVKPASQKKATLLTIKTMADNQQQKTVLVTAELEGLTNLHITYTLYKKENRLNCRFEFDKPVVKEKESLHIAFPFNLPNPELQYSGAGGPVVYGKDHLPGSNREFICVEDEVILKSKSLSVHISSPATALYEVGSIIDETPVNGVKKWKREVQNPASLFIYVFNNYWHTNYKAYQEGHFDFDINLRVTYNKLSQKSFSRKGAT